MSRVRPAAHALLETGPVFRQPAGTRLPRLSRNKLLHTQGKAEDRCLVRQQRREPGGRRTRAHAGVRPRLPCVVMVFGPSGCAMSPTAVTGGPSPNAVVVATSAGRTQRCQWGLPRLALRSSRRRSSRRHPACFRRRSFGRRVTRPAGQRLRLRDNDGPLSAASRPARGRNQLDPAGSAVGDHAAGGRPGRISCAPRDQMPILPSTPTTHTKRSRTDRILPGSVRLVHQSLAAGRPGRRRVPTRAPGSQTHAP